MSHKHFHAAKSWIIYICIFVLLLISATLPLLFLQHPQLATLDVLLIEGEIVTISLKRRLELSGVS